MGDLPNYRQYLKSGVFCDRSERPEWTVDTVAIVALEWLLDSSGDAYHTLKRDLDG